MNKRKMPQETEKPMCKFGKGCYRTNPKHLEEFQHPGDEEKNAEPPKKRKKINDYFNAKPDSAKKLEGENPKPCAIEKCESSEHSDSEKDDIGNESGYCRAGNTSGYQRKEDNFSDTSLDDELADTDLGINADIGSISSPDSPVDVMENIKSKFLVEMPQDFYDFWDFAKILNSKRPEDALQKTLGLTLVGPYDILAGKRAKPGKHPCYLTHYRYYYDPPEFLTVVKGDSSTQFHMGYFRDDPSEMPAFVASNEAAKSCTITPKGDNIFAAVSCFLDDIMKRDGKTVELSRLRTSLTECADKHGHNLELRSKSMKARLKKSVCGTFHGAGMVVPLDDNEVGYRELPETNGDLKKMFRRIANSETDADRTANFEPLVEIITLVQFANDECDYGEGLELAIDLFCFGESVFHKTILNLMPLAYDLLGRPQFKKIIEAHLKNRKHSADVSQLQ